MMSALVGVSTAVINTIKLEKPGEERVCFISQLAVRQSSRQVSTRTWKQKLKQLSGAVHWLVPHGLLSSPAYGGTPAVSKLEFPTPITNQERQDLMSKMGTWGPNYGDNGDMGALGKV